MPQPNFQNIIFAVCEYFERYWKIFSSVFIAFPTPIMFTSMEWIVSYWQIYECYYKVGMFKSNRNLMDRLQNCCMLVVISSTVLWPAHDLNE